MTTPPGTPPAAGDGLPPIEREWVVEGDRAEALYASYLAAFGPLRAGAAARHVLSRQEFLVEMADPRILKCSAWRSGTEPAALATITNHLDAVPWISPDFYTARHPEHAARRAIYYLGFALVVPGRAQPGLGDRVLGELLRSCVADAGILAYDVSSFNQMHVGRRSESALRQLGDVEISAVDTQVYYEAEFR